MRDVGFEQLIILVIFLVMGLVNFVLERLRNRRGRTAQPQDYDHEIPAEEIDLDEALWREGTAELPPGPEPARMPAPAPPRAPSGQGATPSVVTPVSPPRPPTRAVQRRRPRRRMDPREARRGVVLMTILGPCRGIDPPVVRS